MLRDFRWIAWNLGKVEGLTADNVEHVVDNARRPYPKPIGTDEWLVIGATPSGQFIQVIYTVDVDETLFVTHARPLTPKERRRRGRR